MDLEPARNETPTTLPAPTAPKAKVAAPIAYVVPKGSIPVRERVNFFGFPGLWLPGESIEASKLGMSPDALDALIAERGLPHKRVEG